TYATDTKKQPTNISTITLEQTATAISTTTTITTISTSTAKTPTAHQRLLFTHQPWVYHSSNSYLSYTTTTITTTTKPIIISSTQTPSLSSTAAGTVPFPTPWYSPAGP
ncbi:unnamed protein product, partial [Rotaria socialis]